MVTPPQDVLTPYAGQVVIYSLSTPEVYSFDKKRPMRTLALEPQFAKKSTRAFVSGGMAGELVMHEKGWLGHKQTLLHSNEGPIWQVRWKGRLIAWANDLVSAFLPSPRRPKAHWCESGSQDL